MSAKKNRKPLPPQAFHRSSNHPCFAGDAVDPEPAPSRCNWMVHFNQGTPSENCRYMFGDFANADACMAAFLRETAKQKAQDKYNRLAQLREDLAEGCGRDRYGEHDPDKELPDNIEKTIAGLEKALGLKPGERKSDWEE